MKKKAMTRTGFAFSWVAVSVSVPLLFSAIISIYNLSVSGTGYFFDLFITLYKFLGGWGAGGAVILLFTKIEDEEYCLKMGALIYYAALLSSVGLYELGVKRDIGAAVGLVISMMACYIHWQKGEIANLYGKVYAKDREIESYKRKFGSLYGDGE